MMSQRPQQVSTGVSTDMPDRRHLLAYPVIHSTKRAKSVRLLVLMSPADCVRMCSFPEASQAGWNST